MTSSGKTGFTCALIGHILIPTALRLRNRWCDTRRSSNERVGLGRGTGYLWGGRLSLTGTYSKLARQDADYYNLITVHESGFGHEAGTPECLSPRRVLTGVPAGSEASSVLIQKLISARWSATLSAAYLRRAFCPLYSASAISKGETAIEV
jgi:hypothetical protein